MTRKDFDDLRTEILAHAQRINDTKGPDYSHDDENADALNNFKEVGERLGVEPMIVWGVYFEKHVLALERYVKTRKLTSEKLVDRVADLINYLLLGYALAYEEHETPRENTLYTASPAESTTETSDLGRRLDKFNAEIIGSLGPIEPPSQADFAAELDRYAEILDKKYQGRLQK